MCKQRLEREWAVWIRSSPEGAEKHLAKHKKVYCAFLDLEKANDSVWREELSSMLFMYVVGGRLKRALKFLYKDSSACVKINGAYTGWFCISRGVRQGCVASPWLFRHFFWGICSATSSQLKH